MTGKVCRVVVDMNVSIGFCMIRSLPHVLLLNDVHEVSSVLFMLIAHVTVCGGGQDLLSTHV